MPHTHIYVCIYYGDGKKKVAVIHMYTHAYIVVVVASDISLIWGDVVNNDNGTTTTKILESPHCAIINAS